MRRVLWKCTNVLMTKEIHEYLREAQTIDRALFYKIELDTNNRERSYARILIIHPKGFKYLWYHSKQIVKKLRRKGYSWFEILKL